MICPKCHQYFNLGAFLRTKPPSPAQQQAARTNGAKGGRPRKDKEKKG